MLEVWHMWVIAGLLLWIIEIFTPAFVMGVFGTACFIAAPFAGAEVTFKMQLLVFGIATAVLALAIRPLILRYLSSREAKINTNVDALIGKPALVTEVIDNSAGTGRVKIRGETWRAVTSNDSFIDIGHEVTVMRVDGAKLVVQSALTKQGGATS